MPSGSFSVRMSILQKENGVDVTQQREPYFHRTMRPLERLRRQFCCLCPDMALKDTVFLHSCRFRSFPGVDSNERGRPASTVYSPDKKDQMIR